jgi:glycosyltransferase involved in cell wall biosynthesis
VNNPPRILALIGSGVVFGQERANIEVLCALRDSGCEVLCLIRDEAWAECLPGALDAVGLKWRKVAYIEQRMPGRAYWFIFRNPIAFLRGNWQLLATARWFRPTHIHAFNPLFVCAFIPALAVLGRPMVYRAGDKPIRHNWVWRLIWQFVIRQTRQFVANSRYVAAELTRSGVAPDKIRVIYTHPPRRGRVAKFHPPQGSACERIRFVYIGQITPEKGVDVLVDAFGRLADEREKAWLFIAGRISDWSGDAWARALRDRAMSDAELSHRVVFLNYVEDVPGLLQYCDVHVCPSVWEEPLANVVMEAKMAGRPSIIFPSGGLPEVVTHEIDGYICPDKSARSLTAALQTYLDDPSLIPGQGIAARLSLDRLGANRFAQAWGTLYRVGP